MPRRDRLRRVLILCGECARNLAYHRAAKNPEHEGLSDPANGASANFWRVTVNNFIGMCVLEWCKLFADPRGKHYWGNIVTDPAAFKAALLAHLGSDEHDFQELIRTIRRYRDKFLAHLDSEYVMYIPELDNALKAVSFYHQHIVDHEAEPGDLMGLPLDLDRGYDQEQHIAESVYRRFRQGQRA